MPAYLIPVSGASKLITLQYGAYICGRKKAVPNEITVKEFERSITDNSDFPLGCLSLIDNADCELRLPYRHKTKLVTNHAHSSSGFYVLQYVGELNTEDIDILVNGCSLRTLTNETYEGLILTDGDEITFTQGNIDDLEFDAESFRFSLKLC